MNTRTALLYATMTLFHLNTKTCSCIGASKQRNGYYKQLDHSYKQRKGCYEQLNCTYKQRNGGSKQLDGAYTQLNNDYKQLNHA
jgi:hypothetical protein